MKKSMLSLLVFAMVPMHHAAAAVEGDAAPPAVVTGGHWRSGTEEGGFRVATESVGFEHVSCRAWIEWVTTSGAGQPARVAARVSFTEVSNGFWSCEAGAKAVSLVEDRLTLRATHAYSHEARVFEAILGMPGEYRLIEP